MKLKQALVWATYALGIALLFASIIFKDIWFPLICFSATAMFVAAGIALRISR